MDGSIWKEAMIPLSAFLAYTLVIALVSGAGCFLLGRMIGYRRGFLRAAHRAHQQAIPTLLRVTYEARG